MIRISILFLGLLLAANAFAGRTIAVVYDNSGSMANDVSTGEPQRWMRANYALQNMIGLLDANDELALFTMSNFNEPRLISGNEAQLQAQINFAANQLKADAGNTPYDSVRAAMKWLIDEKKPGKAMWLLVLTDGNFQGTSSLGAVTSEIKDFQKKTAANSIFMVIDMPQTPQIPLLWKNVVESHLFEIQGKDIVPRIRQIALMISGRAELSLDSSTKQSILNLKLPLRELTILQQTSTPNDATLQDILGDGQKPLRKTLELSTNQPGVQNQGSRIIRYLPAEGENIIPPSQLQFIFTRPANHQILILPEVALELNVTFNLNGKQITKDQLDICERDQLNLNAWLTEPGQSAPFVWPDNQLPMIQAQIVDQLFQLKMIDPQSSRFQVSIPGSDLANHLQNLPEGSPIRFLSLSAQFQGYFHFRANRLNVNWVKCAEFAMISEETWHADFDKLDQSSSLFRPAINGVPLKREEFQNYQVNFKSDKNIHFEYEITDQGWLVRPQYVKGCACLTDSGKHRVTMDIQGLENVVKSPIERDLNIPEVTWWHKCGPLILGILAALIFIWWLRGIIVKERFAVSSEIGYKRNPKAKRFFTTPLPGSWVKRWLIPYRPERTMVEGVLIEAAPRRKIYIYRESLGRDQVRIYVNGLEIPPNKKKFFLTHNQTMEVEQGRLKSLYKYSCSQR